MIHVRHLRKHYPDVQKGEFVALAGISFDAMPGEVFGLLGPNGAGKTTVLRILSTVLKPSSGRATINGFDVLHSAETVRQQIGFVSTNTANYGRMTAWETVEYFGRLHQMPKQTLAARMESLFDRLCMNEMRDVLSAKMSTGMKQKVSIARALIHDPPVLIFDEATSGLDIVASREVLKIIEQLRDTGKCIVFSSHITSEIERLCDRVAVINHGRILAEGTITDLSVRFDEPLIDDWLYKLVKPENESIDLKAPISPIETEPLRQT